MKRYFLTYIRDKKSGEVVQMDGVFADSEREAIQKAKRSAQRNFSWRHWDIAGLTVKETRYPYPYGATQDAG